MAAFHERGWGVGRGSMERKRQEKRDGGESENQSSFSSSLFDDGDLSFFTFRKPQHAPPPPSPLFLSLSFSSAKEREDKGRVEMKDTTSLEPALPPVLFEENTLRDPKKKRNPKKRHRQGFSPLLREPQRPLDRHRHLLGLRHRPHPHVPARKRLRDGGTTPAPRDLRNSNVFP